jgi:Ca2+-transporting ATPase
MHKQKIDSTEWYRMESADVVRALQSDLSTGLDAALVLTRQRTFGRNEFSSAKKVTFIDRIVGELKNPLTFMLLCAGILTTLLEEYVDASVIFIALMINIVISLYQEGRADRAFMRLRQSQAEWAVVLRARGKMRIPAVDLVPGDVIMLETGMHIPADVRILKSNSLEVNESPLTGEWVDVPKCTEQYNTLIPYVEQHNMGFMGTLITGGSGVGIVTDTGDRTRIGTIATALGGYDDTKTPLQESISKIARILSYVVIGALVFIFLLGYLRGLPFTELLLVSISIAVAAIPEGLPAAVTVILALGMEKILSRGGLVRNLLATETLGSTTVILTDKTGTLTKAEMVVAKVLTYGGIMATEGAPAHALHEAHGDERDVLEFATLTSDAFIEIKEGDPESEVIVRGRPVERAIVSAALAIGLNQNELLVNYPRIDFLPFESQHRTALSLHRVRGLKHSRLYVTGSPEFIFEHSTKIYTAGAVRVLSLAEKNIFDTALKKYTNEGMRLIGVAFRETTMASFENSTNETRAALSSDLILAGFIVLHDPLRADVHLAIQSAQDAGARVIMATGDNLNTARSIARICGIWREGDGVSTGVDVERASDSELILLLKHTTVFARMLPEHKLRLARVLKGSGEVVAMTGDGVNDAPALRAANIGVALGSGTEVAKEASDLVLLNDSFSIIVSSIEEGRRILDNLRKVVAYLLSTSFSEIIIVGGALLFALPIPLLPAQILWINMLTEGFMNFAFAFEPKEDNLMKRDPRTSGGGEMFSRRFVIFIAIIGLSSGALLLFLYAFLLTWHDSALIDVRTIMFVALTLSTSFIAFSLKDLRTPLYRIRIWSNVYLLGAIAFSLLGISLALYVSTLRALLRLSTVDVIAFIYPIGAVLVLTLCSVEVAKYYLFEGKRRHVVR